MSSEKSLINVSIENKLDQNLENLHEEIKLIEEQTILEYIEILKEAPLGGIDEITKKTEDLTEYRKYVIALRSYILLCHAAIEDYIESLAKMLLSESIQNYRDNNKMNEIMMCCTFNYFTRTSHLKKHPSSNFFEGITEYLSCEVNKNNGIKKSNIHGIYQLITNVDLFQPSFDTLGILRGDFAHYNINNSQMKARIFKNQSPQSYVDKVESVLKDLEFNLHKDLIREFYTILT
jgi:hypothetical protein